ncbi:hypothetical protein [Thalassoglobus polymorphus]|uniref:DUF4375 domain-containing protein n=1 Tax=Thalassoglobus polymorphus TaxID=2527994 RepID=A0A517QII9_9PLAN|nr:hypothetical protein [Thalassoglobus polymorphus]QDT31449.1 hypothetical protein Mal48_06820 [Thalassoglobus polymorphus]
MEDYLDEFVDSLGNGDDPHDCWQENGFWPSRVDASLEDICVWITAISFNYLENGGLEAYLTFVSGRALPELLIGFKILECEELYKVCEILLRQFGAKYPRKDSVRGKVVVNNLHQIEALETKFLEAMEVDHYSEKVETYAQHYFEQRNRSK